MTADFMDILQFNEDTLDLVSARFADLVAQDYQQRLLDQTSWQLFQSADEEDFAQTLLQAIGQRSGRGRLVYIALDEPGRAPLTVAQGFAEMPLVTVTPSRSLLDPGTGSLIEGRLVSLALGPEIPAAAGLLLRTEKGLPSALVALESEPEETLLIEFLERLGERASQALAYQRLRKGLEQAGRALHLQRQQMQKQKRLLSLMDDWTPVLYRLEHRCQQWEKLLETAVNSLGGEKGSLMLLDEQRGELVVRATYGLEPEVHERIRRGEQNCRCLKLGEGVAGKVALSLQPLVVNQVDQEPVFLEPQLTQVNSILCLPLHVDGLVLGVMNITHKERGRQFQTQHLAEGMKLACQAARAINHSRLYHLAILDPITEVYTRNHLFQRSRDELGRARRYQRPLSLLAINLQGLEEVRSHHGHEIGNQMEARLSQLLFECVRETDMVARLGPSSFAVLMPETDGMAAMFAAERISQHSRECEMLARYHVAAHIGLCSYPDRANSVFQLISQAEMAMNLAARSSDSLPVVLSPLAVEEIQRSQCA